MGSASKNVKGDLASQFADPPPRTQGPKCNVANLMNVMSESDVAALKSALENPAWTNRNIVSVLTENGYMIGVPSIMRHRRGDCQCPR